MVMPCHSAGHWSMYLPTGSCTPSLPSDSSRRMAAAVNCLVMDARRYLVCGVAGTCRSTSASPYPFFQRLLSVLRDEHAPAKHPHLRSLRHHGIDLLECIGERSWSCDAEGRREQHR